MPLFPRVTSAAFAAVVANAAPESTLYMGKSASKESVGVGNFVGEDNKDLSSLVRLLVRRESDSDDIKEAISVLDMCADYDISVRRPYQDCFVLLKKFRIDAMSLEVQTDLHGSKTVSDIKKEWTFEPIEKGPLVEKLKNDDGTLMSILKSDFLHPLLKTIDAHGKVYYMETGASGETRLVLNLVGTEPLDSLSPKARMNEWTSDKSLKLSYIAKALEYRRKEEKWEFIKTFSEGKVKLLLKHPSSKAPELITAKIDGQKSFVNLVQVTEEVSKEQNLSLNKLKDGEAAQYNEAGYENDQHSSMGAFFLITAIFALVIGYLQAPECSTSEDEEKDEAASPEAEALLPSSSGKKDDGFRSFQVWYLTAWYLCVLGDWFQGSLVYDFPVILYGWSEKSFNEFMVAGFLSAVLLGGPVGMCADLIGRKWACVAYCAFNIVTAVCYFFNCYWILAFGQIVNGIATRILFSAFESWYVSQHFARGYSGQRLGTTLSWMFFGSSLCAILAGQICKYVRVTAGERPDMVWEYKSLDSLKQSKAGADGLFAKIPTADFGTVAGCEPQDVPEVGNPHQPDELKMSWFGVYWGGQAWVWVINIIVLICGMLVIILKWTNDKEEATEKSEESLDAAADMLQDAEENKSAFAKTGTEEKADDAADKELSEKDATPTSLLGSLSLAFKQMYRNPLIILVGLSVALFEGSMYIFVCQWTATFYIINAFYNGPHSEHGVVSPMIFTCLMMSFFCGSCLFNLFRTRYTLSAIAWRIFLVAAFALLLPACSLTYLLWSLPGIGKGPDFASTKLYMPDSSEDERDLITALSILSYFGFCLFEVCVGLYFPVMGSLKADVVEESTRTTTYSLFYIPMNLLICAVLSFHRFGVPSPSWVEGNGIWVLTEQEKLFLCSILLLTGFVLMAIFNSFQPDSKDSETGDVSDEEAEELSGKVVV